MLSWVLGVLRESRVARTVVVGGDGPVRAVASAEGAAWEPDVYLDLNKALTNAFRRVWAGGESAAYIPGDLPLLKVSEVNEAIRTSSTTGDCVTACPAHDGGTNGLVVPPSMSFNTRLGPDSFARHKRVALESGLDLREFRSPGFEQDVDTIADLRACIDLKAQCLDGIAATVSEWAQ